MRRAFDNQPHFAFQNVNDLLLWMRVRWHPTTGCECCEHLIHRVAVCDGPAGDSRANFNRRILSFHGQNPTMGVWMTRMFGVIVAAIWIRRFAETKSIRPQIRFYFPGLRLSRYLAPSLLPSQL